MHSAIIALIATTAGFAAAKPLAKQPECPSVATNTAYYVCGTNGFRGYCSVDPCAKPWCPDFKLKTCYPTAPRGNTTICSGTPTSTITITTTTRPGNTTSTSTSCSGTSTSTTTCSSTSTSTTPCPGTPTPAPRVCSGTAPYYNCANNGFRGACSVDPCALEWCPDYDNKTCNKVERPDPESPCTGCPKTPCTGCPKTPCTDCPKTTCTGSGAFYVCANNGFRGNCSVDPCALNWCPDYKSNTCEAAACAPKDVESETGKNNGHETERRQDNGVCPEGTGYYQVCGNGFRGCCKADACGQASPICPNKSW